MLERAFLDDARTGPGRARLEAEVARLVALFEAAGAERVEPAALLEAEVLLDLYGEDIRARAFVTGDGERELMLRPDFTVPVTQRHMALGAETARYAYAGPVWRRQPAGAERAQEYLQAGFEVFGGADPAAADAEVFALISDALSGHGLTVSTGDMGLVRAAVDALGASPHRRAALMRHLWRPARFHRLLERFSGSGPVRADLVEIAAAGDVEAAIRAAGKPVGRRSVAEVAARVARLAAEAEAEPVSSQGVAVIEAILALKGPAGRVLEDLRAMLTGATALAPAVAAFEARLAALAARGVDAEGLSFEGAYGRTTLEYYDGFVFGFFAPERPELPVIASGGRYDALTARLGAGRGVPAVGGIIRPEALLALEARP